MDDFLVVIYLQYRRIMAFLKEIYTQLRFYIPVGLNIIKDNCISFGKLISEQIKNVGLDIYKSIKMLGHTIHKCVKYLNHSIINLVNKISDKSYSIVETKNRQRIEQKIEQNDVNYYQKLIADYTPSQIFDFFRDLYLNKKIQNVEYYIKLIGKTKNKFLQDFNIYIDAIIDKTYTTSQLFYLLEIYNYLTIYCKQNNTKIIPHEITFDNKLLLFFDEYIKSNFINIIYNDRLTDVIDIKISNPNFYKTYILDFYTNTYGRIQLPNVSYIYDIEQYIYYAQYKLNIQYPLDSNAHYSVMRKQLNKIFLNADQSHIIVPSMYRVFILAEFC